jgi:hypothetical protein
MNRDALKQWCRLQDFLNAPSDSADDDVARLTADGVDVDGAVDRIKSMVRKAYQADLRSQAEAERTQSDRRAAIVREKVASMSLDAVREKLRSFAFGIGNAQPQAAAVAFFREKSADECSEEDLRSLLSDIMTAEESNAESEDTDSPETGR